MKTFNSQIFTDSLLNVDYEQVKMNAMELSKYLKGNLAVKGIDYKKYNSVTLNEKEEEGGYISTQEKEGMKMSNKPQIEIYEYQNFFLLRKTDGELVLLDGFRRLLWYNAPDVNINVRIYNQKDLKDTDVLTLLVNLNHFKFYGGGSYHDRGFALLLRVIFNLNIQKYISAFDAYLRKNQIKNDYSAGRGGLGINTIKERIVNEHFISDIRFLENLVDSNNVMVNTFFGALLYQYRVKYPSITFDAETFLQLQSENLVMVGLMDKYRKAGTNSSAKSQDAVNQIMEIYENIFIKGAGGKVEKSYAELTQECRDLSESIKKDKEWTKLTGNTFVYVVEGLMEKMLEEQKELKFKCVVFPLDYKPNVFIPCGLREDVEFIRMAKKSLGGEEMEFGFKEEDKLFRITHNYGGYHSYGKKYTKAMVGGIPSTNYEINLYVNIPKALVKSTEAARHVKQN